MKCLLMIKYTNIKTRYCITVNLSLENNNMEIINKIEILEDENVYMDKEILMMKIIATISSTNESFKITIVALTADYNEMDSFTYIQYKKLLSDSVIKMIREKYTDIKGIEVYEWKPPKN